MLSCDTVPNVLALWSFDSPVRFGVVPMSKNGEVLSKGDKNFDCLREVR